MDRQREAFVHRHRVMDRLDQQLFLPGGCPGLVLYSRRRVGKSTLLANLPGFLPSRVRFATLSMQSPEAFTTLADLVQVLTREVAERLPPDAVPKGAPADLKGLYACLDAADRVLEADNHRLLLTIDEYENLDAKIGQGIFPEDLLATLRESIQSHRRIAWLFAGSHEIAELTHAPWTSYLVSARNLELPLFTEAETRLLLTQPLKHSTLWQEGDRSRPHFEPGFWGEGGIERIHAEAGGWPHLVQLLASTVVDRVNEPGEHRGDPALLEQAFDQAVADGHVVLRELVEGESKLPEEWAYLSRFRSQEEQPPPDDEAVAQSLRRRWLVVEEGGLWRLRVPLMARWLRLRG